jgi:hypothetical protein
MPISSPSTIWRPWKVWLHTLREVKLRQLNIKNRLPKADLPYLRAMETLWSVLWASKT